MTEAQYKEVIDMVTKLDEVQIDAMTILAESLAAGDSYKKAITKATDFLAMHPGREKQISSMWETYHEYEAKHA